MNDIEFKGSSGFKDKIMVLRFLGFTTLCLSVMSMSGCAVLDGMAMAIERGGWYDANAEDDVIKFQQRYEPEYEGGVTDLLVSSGPNVYVRPYYRLVSAPFTTYDTLRVTVYYECPKYTYTHQETFELKKGDYREIRGESYRTDRCRKRPSRYDYAASAEPYNGRLVTDDAVFVGMFERGAFKRGLVQLSDKVIFASKNDDYKQEGWQLVINQDGTFVETEYQDGEAHGLSYSWGSNQALSASHYELGEIDTDTYYAKEAERAVTRQFNRVLDDITSDVSAEIKNLEDREAEHQSVLDSRSFDREKERIKAYASSVKGGYDDCDPLVVMGVPSDWWEWDLDEQKAYEEEWGRERDLEREACYAMRALGKQLDVPKNVPPHKLVEYILANADIEKLGQKRFSRLRQAVVAYREVQGLQSRLTELRKTKEAVENDVRLAQQYQREIEEKQMRDRLKAQQLKRAEQRRQAAKAQRACFDAHGWGPYDEWTIWPDDHECFREGR